MKGYEVGPPHLGQHRHTDPQAHELGDAELWRQCRALQRWFYSVLANGLLGRLASGLLPAEATICWPWKGAKLAKREGAVGDPPHACRRRVETEQ